MRAIQKLSAAIIACVLLIGTAAVCMVSAAGTGASFTTQNVFKTGNRSNYRIPTAVVTNDGTVWAFCNDRRDSVADRADIQWISASKAAPDGTFCDSFYLLNLEGWSFIIGAAIYDAVNDNIMLFYHASIKTAEANSLYVSLPQQERLPLGSCIIESNDGGETWKARAANLPILLQYPFLAPTFHGSSAGLQIEEGEHAGRLVISGKVANADTENLGIMRSSTFSCIVYSDDFGATWKISNLMPGGSDEASMCILSDGTLYVNSRSMAGNNGRAVGYSYDGGATITDCGEERGVWQTASNGIKGSVISFDNPDKAGERLTLYSCLLSSTTVRKNLCIWISYDDGKTWPEIVTVDPGYTAYSEMRYNPVNEKVYLFYERGDSGPYSAGLNMASFNISWLMENKKPYVPLRINTAPETAEAKLVTENIAVHLKPESLSGYKDGDSISLWKDTSGGGNDAESYMQNASPTMRDDDLNGYPVAYFARNSESKLALQNVGNLDGNCTLFIVFKSYGSTTNNQSIIKNTNINMLTLYADMDRRLFCTSVNATGSAKIHSAAKYDNKYHIMAVVWDSENSLLTQFLDSSRTDVNFAAEDSVKVRREVPVDAILLGENLNGMIAEVIIYDRVLTDTEVAQNGLYLADKFNLVWNDVTPIEKTGSVDSESISSSVTAPPSTGDNSVIIIAIIAAAIIAMIAAVVIILKKKK